MAMQATTTHMARGCVVTIPEHLGPFPYALSYGWSAFGLCVSIIRDVAHFDSLQMAQKAPFRASEASLRTGQELLL